MRRTRLLAHIIFLLLSPTLVCSYSNFPEVAGEVAPSAVMSLDDLLDLIAVVEYSDDLLHLDCRRVNELLALLASQCPQAAEEEFLALDIDDLLNGRQNPIEAAYDSGDYTACMTFPEGNLNLLCAKKHDGKWKKTKRFIKTHKRAIIVGAVVVAAAAVVTAAVVVAAPASAGAALAAGASCARKSAKAPVQEVVNEQVASLSDDLNNYFLSESNDLPLEETGRALAPFIAHESFDEIARQLSPETLLSDGHFEINRLLASDYSSEKHGPAAPYQLHGQRALELGYCSQATRDFSQAISANPADPMPYLERSISYFQMGQYDHSLDDFQVFTSQQEASFGITDFSLGVAKGLPRGLYESGEGLAHFFAEFVGHPIHTSAQLLNACTTLVQLARQDEWGIIGQTLAPEVCEVIEQWDALSPRERGELIGFAAGKHGGDIFIPGATLTVASKGIKVAKALTAVSRNLTLANDILLLEAATEIGNSAKVAQLITTAEIAEELGLSGSKISQVRKAPQHLVNNPKMLQSWEKFKCAQEFLGAHKGFMTESQCRELIHSTGIKTFPRPKGIPENFRVRVSGRGAGLVYVDPKHKHTSIRVMPGKPHSIFPHQQQPYVIQSVNGKTIDLSGRIVSKNAPEAHIPLKEFVLNGELL